MPSLADISAQSETVEIRGHTFEVHGLSAREIAKLLAKFPALRAAFAERPTEPGDWIQALPELVPILVAAAIGVADDPAEIEAAGRLSLEDQLALLEPAFRLTMPGGLVPLANRFTALMGVEAPPAIAVAAADGSMRAQATK